MRVETVAYVDLPFDEPKGRELSGITWDERRGVALAISDETPHLVELRPSADLRTWSFGEALPIRAVRPWDGEGVALAGDRLFVANERPPRVVELDRAGATLADLRLPEHFLSCRNNRCIESLTTSPDGRFLFTATESSLETELEPDVHAGATVHILGVDLQTGEQREWRYATDPVCAEGVGGEIGVSDMAALGRDELLVMERSYVPHVRNRIRLYRVHLGQAEIVVSKTLLLDVAELDPSRFVPNYEGICLGPRLPDGRASLLLVSDDNGKVDQKARLLVLAVR